MPDGTPEAGFIQPEDVLLAIDTAISQLVLARRVVTRYVEGAQVDDGTCRHLRQVETYSGTICQDCGANLSQSVDGVPPGAAS